MATTEATQLDPSFDAFLQNLQEPETAGPTFSPRRYSEALQIDLQTLAELAGVHRNTVARAPASRGIQDFLRESVRVIRAATDLSGDVNKALFWYRNEPIAAFQYKTPERLVVEKRSDDLLRYIVSLGAGPAG